jgi:hypothetical protein
LQLSKSFNLSLSLCVSLSLSLSLRANFENICSCTAGRSFAVVSLRLRRELGDETKIVIIGNRIREENVTEDYYLILEREREKGDVRQTCFAPAGGKPGGGGGAAAATTITAAASGGGSSNRRRRRRRARGRAERRRRHGGAELNRDAAADLTKRK